MKIMDLFLGSLRDFDEVMLTYLSVEDIPLEQSVVNSKRALSANGVTVRHTESSTLLWDLVAQRGSIKSSVSM